MAIRWLLEPILCEHVFGAAAKGGQIPDPGKEWRLGPGFPDRLLEAHRTERHDEVEVGTHLALVSAVTRTAAEPPTSLYGCTLLRAIFFPGTMVGSVGTAPRGDPEEAHGARTETGATPVSQGPQVPRPR